MDDLKARIEALPHWHTEHGTVIHRGDTLALLATHAAEPAPTDNTALVEAAQAVLDWDTRRGYPIPYAVRDPLIAALSQPAAPQPTPEVEALVEAMRALKDDGFNGPWAWNMAIDRCIALARGSVAEKGER